MKITALVTTLVTTVVLGASSVALAKPAYTTYPTTSQHGTSPHVVPSYRDTARDHRAPSPFQRFQRPQQRWMELSSAATTRAGRQVIPVSTASRLSTLKLEATRGSTLIGKVLITFGNGTTQVVNLDKRITPNAPALIDVDGRARQITRIVVQGRGNSRSSYRVLGA
jgi:hypothetical protein